jgi:radical SAM protein with 4Fe4S-binding SPASM domain
VALPTDILPRALRALRREILLRRGGILSAVFGMTYRCNLRCVTCGVWARGETDNRTELTTAEILDTARQLRALGVPQALLIGAEPLLRRDAPEVIEGMRALGLEVEVITNGTLLTEALAERIVRAGVRAITVSIDAVGERHDAIRGQPRAWERAMAGLDRLKEARDRLGADRPRLAVHATISALNTDALAEISGLAEITGLDVSFQLASETTPGEVAGTRLDGEVIAGGEFICRDGTILPDAAGVERIRRFLRTPGILRRHPSLAILASMSDEDIRRGRFPVRRCNVLRGEIFIDPYGDVRPCSHLESYSYGNVREQPVGEIWRGARRRKLVDRVRRELFPVCARCCQHASNLTFRQKAAMLRRGLIAR